jgi:SAM-dependent methyltransferase
MFDKIAEFFRKLFAKIGSNAPSKSDTGIGVIHNYQNYRDYINHQVEKTTDPERIKKWLNEHWEVRVTGFKNIFKRNEMYTKGKQKALCLGSRTGQEVKALLDMGITAIGIDLVPFPPYTVEGDIHDLKFDNDEFDLIFTNIFDHSLFPGKFCSEMERVCKPGGAIIIHLLLGPSHDEYTETVVYDPRKVAALFKSVEIRESRKIDNVIDVLDWELILEKI